MSADTPRRLGRGLEALISTARQQREPAPQPVEASDRDHADLRRVRVADIVPNRFQPRRTFTEPELIEEFGLTQQQVADAVGKDRTSITNLLRVLTLPPTIRALVERGQLTAGHARALLPVKDERQQLALANEIVARQLSVREAEARARAHAGGDGGSAQRSSSRGVTPGALPRVAASTDPAVRRIEEHLRKHLQTDVHVQALGTDRGVVRISYYSPDDLERVLDLIVGGRSDFD